MSSDEDEPLSVRMRASTVGREPAKSTSQAGASPAAAVPPTSGGGSQRPRGDDDLASTEGSAPEAASALLASDGLKKEAMETHEGAESHASIAPADGAELPLVLPEKMEGTRMLVELNVAGDFSGDFGVIGRISLGSRDSGWAPQLQFDLKGVLYDAARVPVPGTLMLVSLGKEEARVEGLLDEYMQLREVVRDEGGSLGADRSRMSEDDEEDVSVAPVAARVAQSPTKGIRGAAIKVRGTARKTIRGKRPVKK